MLQNKNKTKIIAQWNLFIFVLVLNVWLAMYPVWIFARKPSGSSRMLPFGVDGQQQQDKIVSSKRPVK